MSIPLTKPYDIYFDYGKSISVPVNVGYSFPVSNNQGMSLYYQMVTTVALANGSSGSMTGVTAYLGEIANGGYLQVTNYTIAAIATFPSANEIEQVTVAIDSYVDSGLTQLHSRQTFPPISLHMLSDANSDSEVTQTENFAGGDTYFWASGTTELPVSTFDVDGVSAFYYDSSSKQSLLGYTYGWPSGHFSQPYPAPQTTFPFVVIEGEGILTDYLYNGYIPSSSGYTDAVIEMMVKVGPATIWDGGVFGGGQIGWFAVEVDYSDSSPSDNYLFYIPDVDHWYVATFHAKVGLINVVKFASWGSEGFVSANVNVHNSGEGYEATLPPFIGEVRVVQKTSGKF